MPRIVFAGKAMYHSLFRDFTSYYFLSSSAQFTQQLILSLFFLQLPGLHSVIHFIVILTNFTYIFEIFYITYQTCGATKFNIGKNRSISYESLFQELTFEAKVKNIFSVCRLCGMTLSMEMFMNYHLRSNTQFSSVVR